MQRLILLLILIVPLTACENNQLSTCVNDRSSCVRFENNTGLNLRDVRAHFSFDDDFRAIGAIRAGETSDYTAFPGADWCNFSLEATAENDDPLISGGWICGQPDPLGDGSFVVSLTLPFDGIDSLTYLNADYTVE